MTLCEKQPQDLQLQISHHISNAINAHDKHQRRQS